MENWSELPSEIIYSISLRIDNLFDLIHFRSVCSFWRSSSLLKLRPTTAPKCPLPVDSGAYGDGCHVSSSRVYLVKSSSDHNGPRYWLLKIGENENGDIVLNRFFARTSYYSRRVNPPFSLDLLRCQVFELAQEHVACSTWSDGFQRLVKLEEDIGFMSLGADNNEFMVLRNSIFTAPTVYRSVEERWTELQITHPDANLEAIVSYKSKFYAIDITGRTIVVEPTYLQVTTFQRSRPCDKTRKRWLVNSEDKVLLVEICSENHDDFSIPDIPEKKIWFEVSELDVEGNDWNQVEDVDGRVLFLDEHCSFSYLATEIQGFRGNSIIFPDLWERFNNPCEQESILVYEFNEQGVRCAEDIPEYVDLLPSFPGWAISNA
ncbi:putative F-box/kelch-repeat protein At5g24040 [Raphanus sativus]|uniref:F-box/kelch-repeat protein At5g24040 n=1 Tax=Raphanus sativus TaxID=3726 RepID=A0A6J0LLV5_RAPSA|nr:putative F-box/kelch-repeat protein At5g24040 [Raphanus sativus]